MGHLGSYADFTYVVDKGLHFWCLSHEKDQKWDQDSHHAPPGQSQAVQKVDSAIHQINHYPVDSVVCFLNTNTYP